MPNIPNPMLETGAAALEWERLREHLAARTQSPLGRTWVTLLQPSRDLAWIETQHQRTAEMLALLRGGGQMEFRGLFSPGELLDKARIDGAALETSEIRDLLVMAERIGAWRQVVSAPTDAMRGSFDALTELSRPLLAHDLEPLLRGLRGKIEPDGSLSDDASPELRRIRRAMERQHRAIEASLHRALARLSAEGSTQDELITVRGERFVIPVKAEYKRKVAGVVHGSSSSGQTVFVEPLETIEQNNELVQLLEDEQAEIHRILVAMTRSIAQHSVAFALGAEILAEVESHWARARFAQELDCVRPSFGAQLAVIGARHPLLELQLRGKGKSVVPLTMELTDGAKQLIISGPNTGGKTVALKTVGLLALMAQAGIPVPAAEVKLPIFDAVYADIGDAQSIERNLSTFSAHVVNLDAILRQVDANALVLLDELGAATDPEEGAALAVAVAEHLLQRGAWTLITTHLTSMKVYAVKHAGVVNAAVGFDEATLTPTYELRMGVPGASAGLNIAARLGMDASIIAAARAQMSTQTADIAGLLDELHAQLDAANAERASLQQRERELQREREKLEVEGRAEQKRRLRELEVKLESLLKDFDYQLREMVKAIDDKKIATKIQKEGARRMATLRRESSEQFNSTVVAHTTGADRNDPAAQPHLKRAGVGDVVRLRSLGREARVERVVDSGYEVSVGAMKMKVAKDDIAEVMRVEAVRPAEAARRRGNITVSTVNESDAVPSEINVIGKTADEARDEVERFVEQAFLAGLPRIRVVHGVGMGVLRRTLREFLRGHPHVAGVEEPPYHLGGQGVTEVELRQ